jgi:hypothetical protein
LRWFAVPLAYLPVDAKALLALGIDSWIEGGAWPISDEQYRDLAGRIRAVFDVAHASLPGKWPDVVLADIRFQDWVAQYCHAQAVKAAAQRLGTRVVWMGDAAAYYDPNWKAMASATTFPRRLSRLSARLKRHVRRLKYNDHLSLPRRVAGAVMGTATWNLGAVEFLKSEYVTNRRIEADYPDLDEFGGTEASISSADRSTIADVLLSAVQQWNQACREKLDALIDIDVLTKTWLTRVIGLAGFYDSVREALPTEGVLFGGPSNPRIRCISFAARRAEVPVTGFVHGNNPGYTRADSLAYVEFSACTKFVTPTAGMRESLAELSASCPISKRLPTEFSSLETDYFERLRSRMSTQQVAAVRRILLIGFPLSAPRYAYGWGEFFAQRLDLEIRVCRVLRRAGYEVLYKPHPETGAWSAQVLAPEVDQVLLQPFEDVMAQADLFLFMHPLTTTFGVAICSPKPIVLVDVEGRDWQAPIYDLLRRRCAMVRARFDESNRVTFAAADLVAGIGEALELRHDAAYFDAILGRQTRIEQGNIGRGR